MRRTRSACFATTLALVAGSSVATAIEWVEVPDGAFLMGNPEPAIEEWDEAPVHAVA